MSFNKNQIKNKTAGEKIGKYVKYQREKRNWSLQDLAEKTSLTPSYLSRLETGTYTSPTYVAIESLAHGFGIPVYTFLNKCEIVDEIRIDLPDLDFYLREKFQLPDEALDDIHLFLDFIFKKYDQDIEALKKKHHSYWTNRS
ncbi:MAG: helix-turn-helix domain-containing protein [Patescibacteria group bacterium]